MTMPDMSSPTRLNRSGQTAPDFNQHARLNGSIKRRLTSDVDMNLDANHSGSTYDISVDSCEEPARKKSKPASGYYLYARFKNWILGGNNSDKNETKSRSKSSSISVSETSNMSNPVAQKESDKFSTPKAYSPASKSSSPPLRITPVQKTSYLTSPNSQKSSLASYRISRSQFPSLINGTPDVSAGHVHAQPLTNPFKNQERDSASFKSSFSCYKSERYQFPTEPLPPPSSSSVVSIDSVPISNSKPASSQEFRNAMQQQKFTQPQSNRLLESIPSPESSSSLGLPSFPSTSASNLSRSGASQSTTNDHHESKITGIESRKNSTQLSVTGALSEWQTLQTALADIDKIIYDAQVEISRSHSDGEETSESEDDEEEEEGEFPQFDLKEEEMIEDAMVSEPAGEVLNKLGLQEITRKDIDTLRGLNWLNDEVINYYLALISTLR